MRNFLSKKSLIVSLHPNTRKPYWSCPNIKEFGWRFTAFGYPPSVPLDLQACEKNSDTEKTWEKIYEIPSGELT